MRRGRRRRRLGGDLRAAAREPRHGRRLRHGDERHRHGAVGHPRQGGRLAALPPARRQRESRCRRMPAASRSATRTRSRWSTKRGRIVEAGYKAVKLRVGDTPTRDIERVAAVRKAFGDDLVILTDANIGYSRRRRARGHAGPGANSASAGSRSRSRRTTTAATARRRASAARRSPPARTTTPASSSIA